MLSFRLPDIRGRARREAHEMMLVEGFIEGRSSPSKAVMNHGALYELAIFDKPDPLDGPFFEETIYVTPSAIPPPDPMQRRSSCDAIAQRGRRARAHVTDRFMPSAACSATAVSSMLEVAARPIGGLCARRAEASREARRRGGPGHFAGGTAAAPRARRVTSTTWRRESRRRPAS